MIERIFQVEETVDKKSGEASFPVEGSANEVWLAMAKLFENPYWRRVWIIRELAFGREVQLICGSKAIPFSYLTKTMKTLKRFKFGDFGPGTSFTHLEHILYIRNKIESSTPLPLLEAMMRSLGSESTEVVDRVFGLLGLVSLCYY